MDASVGKIIQSQQRTETSCSPDEDAPKITLCTESRLLSEEHWSNLLVKNGLLVSQKEGSFLRG
ncbi:hypothetical protein AVEN_77013-1, partial [Araneus ventricosus]